MGLLISEISKKTKIILEKISYLKRYLFYYFNVYNYIYHYHFIFIKYTKNISSKKLCFLKKCEILKRTATSSLDLIKNIIQLNMYDYLNEIIFEIFEVLLQISPEIKMLGLDFFKVIFRKYWISFIEFRCISITQISGLLYQRFIGFLVKIFPFIL